MATTAITAPATTPAPTSATPSASQATPTLQSAGVGSGLDVKGLVAQLVAAEKAPKQNQITKEQTNVTTTISAMGTLKGALGAFQQVLGPLETPDAFNVRSANTGDEKVFTATATSAAPVGNYDIKVKQLATAHQLSSTAFAAGPTTTVGTGLLSITVGTKGFSINVDSAHASLSAIRDAINKAPDNTGVRAAIVQATDGAHLVLTASKTGAANTVKVAASDGDGGLSKLTYNSPANVANYKELKPAADSIIEIAGYAHQSSSNVVTDAIDGVTLTLLTAQPLADPAVSLDIGNNIDAATTRINNFVSQYNALATTIGGLQSYEPSTQKAGPLLGDSLLRSIDSDLKRGLGIPVSDATGAFTSLASLGITTNKDGTLAVDAAKLKAALTTDFDGVGSLFASANGVAARLDKLITPRLAATGEIATRSNALTTQTKTLAKEQTDLNARMDVISQRYTTEFGSLDTLLSQMQSTASFLTQQFASLQANPIKIG